MTELIFYSIYVFVTFMYGTIFTLMFLDVRPSPEKIVLFYCFFRVLVFSFNGSWAICFLIHY